MTIRLKARSECSRATKSHGLLALMRHRSRRRRNLAELRALDACRLQDIGLSEAVRARMTG